MRVKHGGTLGIVMRLIYPTFVNVHNVNENVTMCIFRCLKQHLILYIEDSILLEKSIIIDDPNNDEYVVVNMELYLNMKLFI